MRLFLRKPREVRTSKRGMNPGNQTSSGVTVDEIGAGDVGAGEIAGVGFADFGGVPCKQGRGS